jgi:hypothetical protein
MTSLDTASSRAPVILHYFAPQFIKLLWCRDANVRTLAYKVCTSCLTFRFLLTICYQLLQRFNVHSPRDAVWVLEKYLQTLDSDDDAVVQSAISHAPDFYHFSLGSYIFLLHSVDIHLFYP